MCPAPPRKGEAGFTLVALLASVAIMLILMGAAVPSWRYVLQNDREEELYFRGDQIALAIERFQKKNGNAAPASLESLVQGRYLRKLYKDPMTRDGKWRLIHPGEALPGPGLPGPGRPGPGASPSPASRPSPTTLSGTRDTISVGPIVGVASTSTKQSIRVFNGRSRYDQWTFVAGQPRVLGRDQAAKPAGGGVSPPPVR